METPPYVVRPGKVIEPDARFKLMMAIALDPTSAYRRGVIRCITDRSGTIGIKGNVDRSVLHKISGDTLERFVIGERLIIQGEDELVARLNPDGLDYLGLEDPDIWIDETTGRTHLYFTIPLIYTGEDAYHSNKTRVSVGHAEGNSLDSLTMTEPVLRAHGRGYEDSFAKEVSIAPANKDGIRFNLFESTDQRADPFYEQTRQKGFTWFSTVRVAIAEDMGKPWQWGETVFHPADHKIPWIAEHASPGPLMPREFIDVGEGKLLGFMNGREASLANGEETDYRTFSVGLFIYDYEHGRIDWVSPEPLIRDDEANTITFASQFVDTRKGEGILYAHVDDSFVRAYTIYAEGLKKLLP
ncbi:MAG TPA: hypothetical protein VF829_01710 [Candidatus Paceibacterota bacterium]